MIRPSSTSARASRDGLGPRCRVRMMVDGTTVPASMDAVSRQISSHSSAISLVLILLRARPSSGP